MINFVFIHTIWRAVMAEKKTLVNSSSPFKNSSKNSTISINIIHNKSKSKKPHRIVFFCRLYFWLLFFQKIIKVRNYINIREIQRDSEGIRKTVRKGKWSEGPPIRRKLIAYCFELYLNNIAVLKCCIYVDSVTYTKAIWGEFMGQ